MWFLPIFAAVLTAQTPATPASLSIPPAIRATLDQEYPGWKLAPVNPPTQKAFAKFHTNRKPSLTTGDFDHDGHGDFAVQIALTEPGAEEQIVIVFLARPTGFEEYIVQSMGLDPTSYLWVKNKDVLMVLGGPAGDTAYKYVEGKFQETISTLDPDHTDPTVPRPPGAL